MQGTPEEKVPTQHDIVSHLKALELRIAHLEMSIHPDQIAHDVIHKIATHLHSANVGTHTPPTFTHDHKA
jgi:hypothetical protein